MRLETLRERIENAKKKIEKKQNTISKKTALITKKEDKLVKLGFGRDASREETRNHDDAYWLVCDIENLEYDIERGTKEIEETKKSLEKYEKQLAGELEKESILIREIPESMKRMQSELVERWDKWDIRHRDHINRKWMTQDVHYDKVMDVSEYDWNGETCKVVNTFYDQIDQASHIIDFVSIE